MIADASLSVLSTLVDKALLWREADGRYHIHELLRQYAEDRLAQSPDAAGHIRDLHCAYYTDFLYRRSEDLKGGRQLEASAEIEAELDNVRAAWRYAIERGHVDAIKKCIQPLAWFYQFRSHYLGGANAFESAARLLADNMKPATL